MTWWVEAWTPPGTSPFQRTVANVPGTFEWSRPVSGVGRIKIKPTHTWGRLSELVDPTTDTGAYLLRLMHTDAAGAPAIAAEYLLNRAADPHAAERPIEIDAPSIESCLDALIAYPYDWPTNPPIQRDHIYGPVSNDFAALFSTYEPTIDFENGTNYGFEAYTGSDAVAPVSADSSLGDAEAGTRSLEMDVAAAPNNQFSGYVKTIECLPSSRGQISMKLKTTAGYHWVAFVIEEDGGVNHVTNAYRVNGKVVVELDDAVKGAGSSDGTWQDLDLDVTTAPGQTSVTFGVAAYNESSNPPIAYLDSIAITEFGYGLEGWEARGDLADLNVATHPVSGEPSILFQSANTTADVNGIQYVWENVTIGETRTFTVEVYHAAGSDRDIRLVLKRPSGSSGGSWLASSVHTIPSGVTTRISITAVMDTEVIWLEVRKADTAAVINTYISGVEWHAGKGRATMGRIALDWLADAQTDHAAESGDYVRETVLWLKPDFDEDDDSNGDGWFQEETLAIPMGKTMTQFLSDEAGRQGYEWRIVPNPDYPATDTETHLLQIANPPSSFTGGLGTDRRTTVGFSTGWVLPSDVISRPKSRNVALGEGQDGTIAVSRDTTAIGVWEPREMFLSERNLTGASLQQSVDQALVERGASAQATRFDLIDHPKFRPFDDFYPGDWVVGELPPNLPKGDHRIVAAGGRLEQSGRHIATIDVGSQVFIGQAATQEGVRRLLTQFKQRERPAAATSGVSAAPFTGPIEVTFLIATYNTRSALRDLADFKCSGVNDEVEWGLALAAIAASTSGLGRIQTTDGQFYFADEASLTFPVGVDVAGAGEFVSFIVPEGDVTLDIQGGWHDLTVAGEGC